MVSKSTVFALIALVGASAAQYNGFQNNLVEFDVPVHLRKSVDLPYPYQDIMPVYGPLTVPAPSNTAVVTPKLGLVSSVVSLAISLIHSAIAFLITNVPAIVVGVLTSFGLCKLTPICTKLGSIQSIEEVREEFRSFATPERITRAAEFVQEAINKYRKMNSF